MTAYIFKSSVSLLLLFGLYWFLLRKEKLFVFNRVFLILSVVFSLLLPFISIQVNFPVTSQINEILPGNKYIAREIGFDDNIVPADLNISQQNAAMKTSAISLSSVLLAVYISGVILLLIRFLRNIYLITRRSKPYEKISFRGCRILLTNDRIGPCCFFSNIFLNRDDYLNGKIDQDCLTMSLNMQDNLIRLI
jgi:hypothetical protein